MIKKTMLFIFLSIFTLFIVSPLTVKAETIYIEEPAANTGGLWHEQSGNRVYVNMRYTSGSYTFETGSVESYYPEYDYSLFTSWEATANQNFSFANTTNLKSASIENPNPDVYDSFHIDIYANMFPFPREGVSNPYPNFKNILSVEGVVNSVSVNLYDYVDAINLAYMTLSVDGEEVLSSQNVVSNPQYYDMSFGVRMYWETSGTIEIDPGAIDPSLGEDVWNDLPETTGSPSYPEKLWGRVDNIIVNGRLVSFDINYDGVKYPVMPFVVDGDLDFINKANDVLYYTDYHTGDRMLLFNFNETLKNSILNARSFSEVTEWKGEALWNLTKMQIKVTEKINTYNYIPEVDKDGNVYSYFYMPNVPMDDLISVTTLLAYQYYDTSLFDKVTVGDIQYKAVAAVRGESTSVNPSWVETTYQTAYITGALLTTITAVATVAGWIPVYGWAVAGAFFLAGGVVGGALHVADVNEWFAYDVNQIEHINPTVAMANEINAYITSVGGANDQITTSTSNLYRLHLANLTDGDDVRVLNDLSNVTQVVWETDGEVYVVNEENIADIDWGGPGTLEPDGISDSSDLTTILWVVGGIAALVMISNLKLDKKPGLLIIILAGVVYILYTLGIISW